MKNFFILLLIILVFSGCEKRRTEVSTSAEEAIRQVQHCSNEDYQLFCYQDYESKIVCECQKG